VIDSPVSVESPDEAPTKLLPLDTILAPDMSISSLATTPSLFATIVFPRLSVAGGTETEVKWIPPPYVAAVLAVIVTLRKAPKLPVERHNPPPDPAEWFPEIVVLAIANGLLCTTYKPPPHPSALFPEILLFVIWSGDIET
jgi:hypothetical protein